MTPFKSFTKKRAGEIVLGRVVVKRMAGAWRWGLVRVHLERGCFGEAGLVSSQGLLKGELGKKVFEDSLEEIFVQIGIRMSPGGFYVPVLVN